MNADIDELYRREAPKILATLIRLLGDFDRAEEARQYAFRAAIERWPSEGVPTNPRAWLIAAGRFRAIDRLRKQARLQLGDVEEEAAPMVDPTEEDLHLADDALRLIFACCHPALTPEAQVALTLREVCGLTTDEIASAFLVPVATLHQRIVRAKAKIRDQKIPYSVPEQSELALRLDSVLSVVYLIFNEGYAASSGESLTRVELSREAIRLVKLLASLLPEPEVLGLLGLMLLAEARRETRTTVEGDLVLLPDQDRTHWDRALLEEGRDMVEQALRGKGYGAYTLQAAIAAGCDRCSPRRTRRTGSKSWGSTTCSIASCRLPSLGSTAPSRSRCATAPLQGST